MATEEFVGLNHSFI